MATNLTLQLRNDITKQVTELFFPEGTCFKLKSYLRTLWKSYLDENFGCLSFVEEYRYSFSFSKDNEMQKKWHFFLASNHRFFAFSERFVNLPFCSLDEGKKHIYIDIDKCPLTNFRNMVIALINFSYERQLFSVALYSELSKSSSLEAFARKFPNLKGALSLWLEDSIVDLPVECSIDLNSVGMSIAV